MDEYILWVSDHAVAMVGETGTSLSREEHLFIQSQDNHSQPSP